jgi:hypothetical protein
LLPLLLLLLLSLLLLLVNKCPTLMCSLLGSIVVGGHFTLQGTEVA